MLKNSGGWFYGMVFSAAVMAVVSCGTKKAAVDGRTQASGLVVGRGGAVADAQAVLRKVYANQADARCISSKIKFTLRNGRKDLSVSGSLRMKKDEVVRIQLTAFGLMEVGRLEFTKDYVLLMDRMNKQYVKVRYADVGFLRSNGLDFYVLQALFWNQLFIPGRQGVDESSLGMFAVADGGAAGNNLISLEQGGIGYLWSADKADGRITNVDVTYSGKSAGATSVSCAYGSFKPLGAKQFPTDITLALKTAALGNAGGMSVDIAIDKLGTDDGWDTFTTVSGKYKQVSVEDIINMLLKQ